MTCSVFSCRVVCLALHVRPRLPTLVPWRAQERMQAHEVRCPFGPKHINLERRQGYRDTNAAAVNGDFADVVFVLFFLSKHGKQLSKLLNHSAPWPFHFPRRDHLLPIASGPPRRLFCNVSDVSCFALRGRTQTSRPPAPLAERAERHFAQRTRTQCVPSAKKFAPKNDCLVWGASLGLAR